MTKLLLWNNNNNQSILVVDTEPDIIYKMIECIHFLSESEMEDMFPIEDFTKIYWALFDYEFVDVLTD